MNFTKISALIAFALIAIIATISLPVAPAEAAQQKSVDRWLIDTRSGPDHAALKADLEKAGTKVFIDMPEVNILVVGGNKSFNGASSLTEGLKADHRVLGIGKDSIKQLIRPDMQSDLLGTTGKGQKIKMPLTALANKASKAPQVSGTPPGDTAFSLPGLMWDFPRIKAFKAWNFLSWGFGQQGIKVAVADTGIDYTHTDMLAKVDKVVDFTNTEQPNICSYFFSGPTDQELADYYGVPSDLDFNGHGSWIAGNIAANSHAWNPQADISGTTGIAFNVGLVALKISQNCGSAYDSEIMDAFNYAANNGIDVVSISFGGYTDRTLSYNDVTYNLYKRVVDYAAAHGTVIVAAAGNEHTKIGVGGRVLTHGILSSPPGGTDYFGLYETPGGIPGVIDVSSTGNVVNAPTSAAEGSPSGCPRDAIDAGTSSWCKPSTDAHQSTGVGKKNQLTYYSNYGPRIDFAAPGGARKFNLPAVDRGGCPGWPYCGIDSEFGGSSTVDGYNDWEEFSMTTNYGIVSDIDCFFWEGDPVFPDDQCYVSIQGTSMATPHVSAVAAVVLSNHPEAYKNPSVLYSLLKAGAKQIRGNTTPPVSATDTSPTDVSGTACPGGYCHLGGARISDANAYGNGLIDVYDSAK